jgi:hypothetical protein
MNYPSLVVILGLILSMAFPMACSQKQPADIEISLETPTVSTTPLAQAAAPPTVLAQAPTPTETPEPLEYEVDDIKGNVLVLYDGETDPEPAEGDEVLEQGDELITKADSEATLTLNDITAIHVSEGTTVKISELQPNNTGGFLSRLELAGGKVLSEVEELDQAHSSFEVDAGGVVCGVRGTSFEVLNQNGNVQTNTFHGAVEVAKENHSQLVKAGEHSAFSFKKGGFLPKRKLNAVEKKRYQSWSQKYQKVRQKRAERMNLLKTNPQSPEAQRILARHQAIREKREQFRSQSHAPVANWNQEQHPKPPERQLRRKNHPGNNLRTHSKFQQQERVNHPGIKNKPGLEKRMNRPEPKINHSMQRPNPNHPQVQRPLPNRPKPAGIKMNHQAAPGSGNNNGNIGKKKDRRKHRP